MAEGVEEHEQKKEEKVVDRAAQKVRQYIEFENIPIRTMWKCAKRCHEMSYVVPFPVAWVNAQTTLR